jgi:hypothetical protein
MKPRAIVHLSEFPPATVAGEIKAGQSAKIVIACENTNPLMKTEAGHDIGG